MRPPPPAVLVFAGSDPSGGAGIQADILALHANGCHALPVITAVTVQDTHNVHALYPLSDQEIRAQAQTVLADIRVAACKIGLLGSLDAIRAVAAVIRTVPGVPVVLDPVLAAGGGSALSDHTIVHAIRNDLLPLVSVLTPNSREARALGAATDLPKAARNLLSHGCRYVLITGTHEDSAAVHNTLYHGTGAVLETLVWPRLPGEYHGSGCTLAAALTAGLALGLDIAEADRKAQEYTWHALEQAFTPGRGQALPRR